MPRFARVVVPGYPHHVTQRGNAPREIFFSRADREVYLGLLQQYSALHQVEILGFCLMTNHVHLVLVPSRPTSMAKTLREVQMRYSQYRHALERGCGHLWQGRYYSCAFEFERLGAVMRYIELNPVRAGLARAAEQYAWSSATVHLGGLDELGLVSLKEWRQRWAPEEWREVLSAASDDGAAIREATYGGRPLGSRTFVAGLERSLGRRLVPGRPGRPKKTASVGGGCVLAGGCEI